MRTWWPSRRAALDWGSGRLKAVSLRLGPAGPGRFRAAEYELDPDQPRPAFDRAGGMAKRAEAVVLGLDGGQANHRWLDLPRLSGQRLRSALTYDMEDRTAGPDDLAADLLPQAGDGEAALVLAVDRSLADQALSPQTLGGLSVRALSLDTVGLINAARTAGLESGLVVDVGQSKTTIIALNHGRVTGLTLTDAAGDRFDRLIARRRNIDLAEARKVKESLADRAAVEVELADGLTELTAEIERTVRAAFAGSETGPDRLLLSGGGSRLAGLDAILAERLNLPVERLKPAGLEVEPQFAAAAGLALGGLEFDLGRGRTKTGLGRWLKLTAVALAACLALVVVNVELRLQAKRSELDRLRRDQVELVKKGLPHLGRVVAPIKQVDQELTRARQQMAALERGQSSDLIIDRLAAVNRLTDGKTIKLSDVVIDGPKLQLVGTAVSYQALEKYQAALAADKKLGPAALEKSRLADGGVKFTLKVAR